ncbi:nose resistant to fluoxetine protein 6-like [Epargyreus clarus]|uniref:nose resistant to fluoxetine protein 6-like n=1 Tax=Epargyreus clarus TaxID=520877 RepID=UPI003C2CC986
MKGIIFAFLLSVHFSYGEIYRLNVTEYLRMPPLYHLDDYDSCVYQPNGTYCYVDIDLVSDSPNDLLLMIREYSEHNIKHFNHTRLHRGVCLTKTCQQYLHGNNTVDQRLTVEKCLNDSFWKDYKLKTRLNREVSCKKLHEPMNINVGDILAAVFFTFLILINFIGSLYDLFFVKDGKGNKLLLSFSLKRNWKKLLAQDQDPNRESLQGFHGIRTLMVMGVIVTHAPVMLVMSTENPYELEQTYYDIWFHVIYNGCILVQTFFVMAGCLMAFNIKVYAEKHQLHWTLIPKGILFRWLRLTPANAVVLIFTLTWIRFVASGPLWETLVGAEVKDCHRNGWMNMIYLNNYVDNSQCMAQTWYLASDMQLYTMGLFACILAKTARSRKIVLSILFVIGVIIPGIFTYLKDLDAFIFLTPEAARNFLVTYPTFNESKRGHTNIPAYVIGLALGNFIYNGLKDESRVKNFKKLGYLYYLTVPMVLAYILSGFVFYQDRPKFSIYLRAIVASFVRPVFDLLLAVFFIGMVFKYENLYRRILEWRGWRVPARVSYSAYIIHVPIIRIFGGMNSQLLRMGLPQCIKEGVVMVSFAFLAAYPFWLFVEAPLNQAVFHIMGFIKEEKKQDEAQKMNSVNQTDEKTVIELDNRNKGENIRI